MCGILFAICKQESVEKRIDVIFDSLQTEIRARGPDGFHCLDICSNQDYSMRFGASVLHLRGPHVQLQPLTHPRGDILCWNGEIFGGSEGLKLEQLENLNDGQSFT